MLRRETIVDIERDKIAIQGVDNALAKVTIFGQIAKHPPPAVEVDISGPFLPTIPILCGLGPRLRLKDAHGDLAAVHGAFLLRDAVDIRPGGPAVRDGVFGRVLAVLLDRHLVGVQPPGVVPVVVLDVDGVEAGEQVLWDTVVESW